jgi:hypothetical protein
MIDDFWRLKGHYENYQLSNDSNSGYYCPNATFAGCQ